MVPFGFTREGSVGWVTRRMKFDSLWLLASIGELPLIKRRKEQQPGTPVSVVHLYYEEDQVEGDLITKGTAKDHGRRLGLIYIDDPI